MKNGRVFLVVLDGVGIGEAPDAKLYGDEGSNTLGNLAEQLGGLALPFLGALGLGNIAPLKGIPPVTPAQGAYGKMREASAGKDTITGHWEMTGVVLDRPFPVYPNGFPGELISALEKESGRKVLGNKVASGTEIIKELGAEQLATGALIVYTSADSVMQIAAHEEVIPVDELYRICLIARRLLQGEHRVARVIARPFTGEPGAFQRTTRRRDFAVEPPEETILDRLAAQEITTVGIGKIEDIFSKRGLAASYHTGDNLSTLQQLLSVAGELAGPALVFANCVDFDTLYGHRNDLAGFARALTEVDAYLKRLVTRFQPEDLLVVTADHGCDPTTPSTDHSREYVPLLVTGEQVRQGVNLGTRASFTDLAATLADYFGITGWTKGNSFYPELMNEKITKG